MSNKNLLSHGLCCSSFDVELTTSEFGSVIFEGLGTKDSSGLKYALSGLIGVRYESEDELSLLGESTNALVLLLSSMENNAENKSSSSKA